MALHHKLNQKKVNELSKPGRYGDGGGLYAQVTTTGPSWIFRYELSGKEQWMGLGPLCDFTLTASSICLIDQAGVYRCLVLAVRRKAPAKTQKAYSLMIGISTKTAMIATIPITRAMRNPQCICNPQGHAHSASKLRSM